MFCLFFTIYFLFRSIFFSRLILQWALCAAALHGGLHLLRKGRSVGALEADLPSPALGGGAAQARAADAWTPSDFTGGGAVFMTHITLEQLTDHLSLARGLCFTGRPAVPRLAVTNWLAALRHPALSVHTVQPLADGGLFPSVTELARVSICTRAAVRGALRHTHTVHTPAALTGALGGGLFTQWAAVAAGTLAGHACLSSLSAGPVSTDAAGVTARQDALHPCQPTAEVLELPVEPYVMNAAVKGLEGTVWTRSQACCVNQRGHTSYVELCVVVHSRRMREFAQAFRCPFIHHQTQRLILDQHLHRVEKTIIH